MKPVVVEGAVGCRTQAFLFVSLFVALGVAFGPFRARLPAPVGDGSMDGVETVAITMAAGLAWGAIAWYLLPPIERVELKDEGVVQQGVRFGWSNFVSYDDGRAEYVTLRLRDGAKVYVPTANEEARRAVLEVLETRLPRG